ncbi:hypothetical protein AB0C07_26110 [Actinoplanes missouriensis]|uniref:hypothetical protein n=1 Tax=Actinoplanes missouriensis TaxID=1866 RepID=UPI0033CE39B4
MRKTRLHRVAAVLAGALLGLTALANPAMATGNHGNNGGQNGGHNWNTGDRDRCTTVENAKYKHWFDGPAGTASIELLNGPLCKGSQAFALVSYTTPSAQFSTPQYILDKSIQEFTAPDSKSQLTPSKLDFKVEVPECFTQVDFVFGKDTIDPLVEGGERYNNRKVGSKGTPGKQSTPAEGQKQEAFYNGGSGTCVAQPVVETLPDCEGNLQIKLINRSTHSSRFTITTPAGTKVETLAARQEPKTITVPAAEASSVKVTALDLKTKAETELFNGGWTKPEDCQVPEVGTPEANFVSNCDGVTFTIKNPENGKAVTSTFTPSTGEAQTITAQPGETKTAAFPASEGLKITVTGDLDVLNGEVVWTKPADCTVTPPGEETPGENPSDSPSDSPSESPSATPSASVSESASPSVSVSSTPVATVPVSDEEDGGSLPVTGAAAGGIAGGAALLLVVGAGLFFMARRRKLNFKA